MNPCLLKLTPNDFLFKLKTNYTVMFGILITSAVYTWHFVYLTVLFFLLFSFVVAITGWMVHGLWPEVNDRVVRLWDGGDKKEEKSHRLPDRQRRRRTDNLSALVCMRWEVCDEDFHLSSFPSFLWMVEVAGGSWGGGVCFLFSDVASDDPGGPAPPTPPADEG